ncbi:cellulose synthase [Nocardiopsis sp. YSL2]|uniref:cellulose synthase n=1 Tax=Nocardiopsis sp. YSL2 TaxID=2939492 RepID=UPI0026F4444F|nr:cellulose synthase [Nocardiopsis sp. YSL2]
MPDDLTATAGLSLGAALTIAGLLITFFVWRRKGAASGLRGVAWSLLPLAAGLLGLMNAIWQFVLSLLGIVAGLALNPLVWAGAVLVGLSVVLYVVSGFMRLRGLGTSPRGAAKDGPSAPKGEGGAKAVGPAAGPAGQVGAKAPKKSGADDLSDFSDIEEMLRKRGIE